MPTILDNFPASSLDPAKWTSLIEGTTGLSVGVPNDGVYPQNVDDDLDSVTISSKDKLSTPQGQPFDASIFYEGVFIDAEQEVLSFLGWRSYQEIDGNPAYGVDFILCVKSDGVILLQKNIISNGNAYNEDIMIDPLDGFNSGFRIERQGGIYLLQQWFDGGWVLRDSIDLGYSGAGYIQFGQLARNEALQFFPWISQT